MNKSKVQTVVTRFRDYSKALSARSATEPIRERPYLGEGCAHLSEVTCNPRGDHLHLRSERPARGSFRQNIKGQRRASTRHNRECGAQEDHLQHRNFTARCGLPLVSKRLISIFLNSALRILS